MLNKKINSILRYPEKLRCNIRLHMLIGVALVSILKNVSPINFNFGNKDN